MSATPDSTVVDPKDRLIADLQRQLAERTAERDEALAQQTATAEVLQVINSSPGDLTPVFDALLDKAMRLCDAAFGYMTNDHGRTVATRGVPETYAEFRRNNPVPAGQGGIAARLREGAPFVHIVDLKDDERYRGGMDPQRRAMVDLGGARTALHVPLWRGDIAGGIAIYRQQVRPFSDKQIALLQNFAGQAVIAVENARLIVETREALEQQTATAEVLGIINSSPGDLAPVFDAMLERAMRLCKAKFGIMFTVEDEVARIVAERDVPVALHEFLAREPLPIGPDTFFGRAILERRILHTSDAREGANYRAGQPLSVTAVDHADVRALLMAPLLKDHAALGVFAIFRTEARPFSDKQTALLQSFAAQAVIAMENARLLGELRQRTDEVAELNRGLEARVAEQVEELGRVGRLKRFLAPQLAELIVSQGDEKILESHRREIVVVFCDLRGYTAFTETAEPEEVLDFLREYHGALGPLVSQFEGTLDQFSGDGIMVFFNDPVPIPNPAERAVKMAMAMREAAGTLIAEWHERGRDLGFGAGIAQGYATLGQIGFSERSGYTAIGTVCNVAARLCAEAKDGQILLSQRINVALKGSVATEQLGALALKGLTQPVVAYNVPLSAVQPAFRVIEGRSPSD
jgi:adenylate cyclase